MILFLVVCVFGVTIEIFCPNKPFINEDLPAFGGPTIATMPDLIVSSCISLKKILMIIESINVVGN
jgi:hypothetical protein